MEIELDGREIIAERDFHRQLAMALGVQDFYGYNLDALWDLLSASVERPLILIWKYHDFSRRKMDKEFDKIIDILEKVRRQDEDFGWEEKFFYVLA